MLETITNIDGSILLWIQENLRNEILTPIAKFITHSGDSAAVWIIIALIFLILAKTRKTGVLMLLSLLGSFIINNLFLKI